MTDFEKKTLTDLELLIRSGKLTDSFMVSGLKLLADYSNLCRVKEYADRHGISPQGCVRYRNAFKLAGYNVITDPN